MERVQDSYEALQDAKRSFANDFRHLLKTYMEMMENMEVSSAREIEAALRERLDTESVAVVREAARQEPAEGAGDPEDDAPAFGASDAADLDDPGATRPIETVAAPEAEPEGASGDEPLQGTGPLADEPQQGEQETQVLSPGGSMTFGSETDDPQTAPAAADAPAAEPVSEEPASEEPVATEPETEPSTASGGTTGEPATGGPGAADEVEREEEPTLAEESRSHEFFDRENREEEKESRISRASRFLRRRD
ncbi:MAG: Cell division initiation protein DivIVA [uncultured Rubrobacteraceae bacterium]|uniref:Cell division initiation protein DivIVA n=1 Tax=uncultured Rubrobacteraceae bacterium TaxID=349277 RepID=A0A6J4RA86_9ACTN|nr:MAG: Cell division initiation protein DivIVA [uncultured Rubrobacteraceae bacterium]